MIELQDSDRKILRILQTDSRTSVAKIAEQVGLSASTCWRRIAALEESGVISRFGVRVDPQALGLGFQAIVNVQLDRHDKAQIDAFFRAIRTQPEVRECYAVTGRSDYHMMVNCRDAQSYNTFLEEFLFQLPAVASAQTNMVLKVIKQQDTVI